MSSPEFAWKSSNLGSGDLSENGQLTSGQWYMTEPERGYSVLYFRVLKPSNADETGTVEWRVKDPDTQEVGELRRMILKRDDPAYRAKQLPLQLRGSFHTEYYPVEGQFGKEGPQRPVPSDKPKTSKTHSESLEPSKVDPEVPVAPEGKKGPIGDGRDNKSAEARAQKTSPGEVGPEDEGLDWMTVGTTAAKGAATVLAIGGAAVAAGASAPFLAVAGLVTGVGFAINSYFVRGSEAMDAGVEGWKDRALLASASSVLPWSDPVSFLEAYYGYDYVTGAELTRAQRSMIAGSQALSIASAMRGGWSARVRGRLATNYRYSSDNIVTYKQYAQQIKRAPKSELRYNPFWKSKDGEVVGRFETKGQWRASNRSQKKQAGVTWGTAEVPFGDIHGHHTVLASIIKNGTNPKLEGLDNFAPTILVDSKTHIELHRGLNAILQKKYFGRTLSDKEVKAAIRDIKRFYQQNKSPFYKDMVDAITQYEKEVIFPALR